MFIKSLIGIVLISLSGISLQLLSSDIPKENQSSPFYFDEWMDNLIKRSENRSNPQGRLRAAREMGYIKHPQIKPALLNMIVNDRDPIVRRVAIYSLSLQNDPQTIPNFINLLDENDSVLREVLVSALAYISVGHETELAKGLESSNKETQKGIILALGRTGTRAAVDIILAKGLNDSKKVIRLQSLHALEIAADTSAIGRVEKMTKDSDSTIAKVASHTLEILKKVKLAEEKAMKIKISLRKKRDNYYDY